MTARLVSLLCLVSMPLAGAAQPPKKARLEMYGSPLPDGVSAWLGQQRFPVTPGFGVAVSPDGRFVATGLSREPKGPGELNRVIVYDADAGKPVYLVEGFNANARGGMPAAFTYSRHGRLIAGTDSNTNFQVWDLPTRKLLWRDETRRKELEAKYVVAAFRFIDDDKFLAIAYKNTWSGPRFEVELREADTGKRITLWKIDKAKQAALDAIGPDLHFQDVALSPTGERMAWLAAAPQYAKNKGTCVILVFETASGKLLRTVTVTGLPFTLRVDMPDEGETLVLVPYRPAPVNKIINVPATVVNVADGRTRFTIPYRFRPTPDPTLPYGVSPDGHLHAIDRTAVKFRATLLTFDEVGMTRWDWKTGKMLEEYNEPFSSFSISRDGERIAVREGTRLGTSVGKLASLSSPGAYSRDPFVRFLSDGRVVGFEPPIVGDGMLHVWHPRTRQCLQSMRLFAFPREGFLDRFDAWGKTLVYPRHDGTNGFVTYDLITNQRIASGVARGEYQYHLSGDGKRVLAAGHVKNQLIVVRWFDAESTRELGRYEVADAGARPDLVQWFSDDGSKFGYVTADNQLALVDCLTKKLVRTIGTPATGDAKDIKLEYVSVGFHRLIWSRPARKPGELPPPVGPIEHAFHDHDGRLLRKFIFPVSQNSAELLVSPDARSMAICIPDQKILIVETISSVLRGKLPIGMTNLASLPNHRRADFSYDGTMLATSHLNTIWIWDLARPLGDHPAWPAAKDAADAERLWGLLGDPDPAEADRALWALVSSGKLALQLFKEKMAIGPPLGLDAKRLQELIVQLDSANFTVRSAADKELDRAKQTDLPALRAARKMALSVEQGRRLDDVIGRVEARNDMSNPTRPWLRESRALHVLERIGGADARQIVQSIAMNSDGLRESEAQFVLARWR